MSAPSLGQKLAALFGKKAPATQEGIQLDVRVKGYHVTLTEREKAGEYGLTVSTKGMDSHRTVSLAKSDSQYNVGTVLGTTIIPADHEYSRIVVDIISPHDARRRDNFVGVELNSPKAELCVVAYVRNAKGEEKMWSGVGIDSMVPQRGRNPVVVPA